MKDKIKKILKGMLISNILLTLFGLFVKVIQIAFFPDVNFFILVLRCAILIAALPVISAVFWLGFALIIKYTLEKILGEKIDVIRKR